MLGLLYAMVTVLAWGTWLAPSQNVSLRSQQVKTFYVASINLALAGAVAWTRGLGHLTFGGFWLPFVGGLIWAASGLCAFTAANRLGMARAFGLWAPLNIIVSLICGRILFGEFVQLGRWGHILLGAAVCIIISGVLLIIVARPGGRRQASGRGTLVGLSGALGAGILWGIYFIPIKLSGASLWIAAFPMAIGIFAGSVLLMLPGKQSPRLTAAGDYLRVAATGALWTVGNYGMLLLVDYLGAGKGYTIAQLSVVINALVGIYWLADPPPRTRAARLILTGCVLATLGGILLGNLG